MSTTTFDVLQQQEAIAAQLPALEARGHELERRATEVSGRRISFLEAKRQSPTSQHARFDKPIAAAERDLKATLMELDATNAKINALRAQLGRVTIDAPDVTVRGPMTTITAPPAPSVPLVSDGLAVSGLLLLLPLVIALSRRIWVRGGRQPIVDIDASPRLQRIEQAVESIAIEVERIGEAQRFTTRMLSELSADPVAGRIPPAQNPRREPGTITPH